MQRVLATGGSVRVVLVTAGDGYVEAVRKAAAKAISQGFLLQPDADALIARAAASNVLNPAR